MLKNGVKPMEDKTLEIVTQMYSQMKERFDNLDNLMVKVESNLTTKSDKQDIVRIEEKLEDISKILFDGYTLVYEKIMLLDDNLHKVSEKIDKQELKFRIIKNIAN